MSFFFKGLGRKGISRNGHLRAKCLRIQNTKWLSKVKFIFLLAKCGNIWSNWRVNELSYINTRRKWLKTLPWFWLKWWLKWNALYIYMYSIWYTLQMTVKITAQAEWERRQDKKYQGWKRWKEEKQLILKRKLHVWNCEKWLSHKALKA